MRRIVLRGACYRGRSLVLAWRGPTSEGRYQKQLIVATVVLNLALIAHCLAIDLIDGKLAPTPTPNRRRRWTARCELIVGEKACG